MESDLSTSSFSIDNILKPDKCDSTQEPRSADRALTLAERLAGEYIVMQGAASLKNFVLRLAKMTSIIEDLIPSLTSDFLKKITSIHENYQRDIFLLHVSQCESIKGCHTQNITEGGKTI